MAHQVQVHSTNRALFALAALAICSAISASCAVQHHAAWLVVSSRKMDSRIERQFQQVATQQGVALRFTSGADEKPAMPSAPNNLELLVDLAPDRQSFLDELRMEAGAAASPSSEELTREGYILEIDYSPDATPRLLRIKAAAPEGLHNALLRIPEMLAIPAAKLDAELIPRPQSVRIADHGARCVIADYPSFPVRGVVEGFYGKPWSQSDRLAILRFEGRHGMNLYLYGPKDDPYHRRLWRDPYPPEQLRRLGELARAARENFVDFSFAISPGLSMTYSSDADFQALVRKIDSVRRLGVTHFALFLDDVPQELVHAEDRARFHSLAQAHVQLLHRVYDYLQSLSPSYRLTVCPTTYTNEWGSRDYIRELGAGLRPEIPLNWTGTEVIPPAITVEQANQWAGSLHRKPLVWDNYPTDDGNNALPNIDPLRGRDAKLFTAVSGLFSNPMNQAHLTLIPLETVSDYLWNATAYDPQASETHAIASQYGQDAPALLSPLLEMFAAAGKSRADLRSLFDETWEPIDAPSIQARIAGLRSMIVSLQGQPRFGKLVAELNPIADALASQLNRLRTGGAFNHLADGRIQWNRASDVLSSSRIAATPALDGDFAKWESHHPFLLKSKSQIADGQNLWTGPSQFSARVAMSWDEKNLYFGIDVTDPQLYQPFFGRGVENGDSFRLTLNTLIPGSAGFGRLPTVFDLYLSPGNFDGVKPSIYCDEDLSPARPAAHDYNREIKAVWKQTATGYSGDIAIPAAFFGRQDFAAGRQIGLSFAAQKVFAPPDHLTDSPGQIVFSSKGDSLFPVDPENPATLQQMELIDSPASSPSTF